MLGFYLTENTHIQYLGQNTDLLNIMPLYLKVSRYSVPVPASKCSFPVYLWASAYFSPFRFAVLLLVLIFSTTNQPHGAQPLLGS